jgi:hypothetical protein
MPPRRSGGGAGGGRRSLNLNMADIINIEELRRERKNQAEELLFKDDFECWCAMLWSVQDYVIKARNPRSPYQILSVVENLATIRRLLDSLEEEYGPPATA